MQSSRIVDFMKKLRDCIKARGWLQTEFAERCEVDTVTVYRWISGKNTPSPKHLKKIKEVTNGAITPNDFYEDDPHQEVG